jgi:2-amino-4-hydroxy-6-hydroxymethyldihydropteridine diphosphokinase
LSISEIAYIALGTNKGDREDNLKKAVEVITSDSHCNILDKSSVYETSPFGNIKQDNFLNAVISIRTDYWLKELFHFLKNTEVNLGRSKTEKWGPREIDLDLLFFGKMIYSDFELNIPHSGIMSRDFVLVPFIEIAPDFIIPEKEIKISQIDLDNIEKNIISRTDYKL